MDSIATAIGGGAGTKVVLGGLFIVFVLPMIIFLIIVIIGVIGVASLELPEATTNASAEGMQTKPWYKLSEPLFTLKVHRK